MGQIFISYRREDTADIVGRMNDRLQATFGRDRVFKDVHAIGVGADIGDTIDQALETLDALIVVIGPDWVGPLEDGERRIDDPADWVHREVAGGLQRQIPIFPVLVKGARPLTETHLPDVLSPLAGLNALSVRPDPDFDSDIERLTLALPGGARSLRHRRQRSRWTAGAVLAILLVALAAVGALVVAALTTDDPEQTVATLGLDEVVRYPIAARSGGRATITVVPDTTLAVEAELIDTGGPTEVVVGRTIGSGGETVRLEVDLEGGGEYSLRVRAVTGTGEFSVAVTGETVEETFVIGDDPTPATTPTPAATPTPATPAAPTVTPLERYLAAVDDAAPVYIYDQGDVALTGAGLTGTTFQRATTDRVETGFNPSSLPPTWSIQAWFVTSDATGRGTIVGGFHDVLGGTAADKRWYLAIQEGRPCAGIGSQGQLCADVQVADGAVHHLALTVENQEYALFVDGDEVAAGSVSHAAPIDAEVSLGAMWVEHLRSWDEPFDGTLGHVAIHPLAFDAEQVRRLAALGRQD